MYQKDFNEYIRILLRTQNSYSKILKELEEVYSVDNTIAELNRMIKSQILICKCDNDKLIDSLKERGDLKL